MPSWSQPLRSKWQALKEVAGKKKYIPPSITRSSHTIFSGIQPTGVPHLGNYLGALRQWKGLQDERLKEIESRETRADKPTQLFLSVVDLHALTHKMLREERLRRRSETFASLLAIGLDPKLSTIFYQSSISAHSELMWILSTIASTGYLSRMTQWKAKSDVRDMSSFESSEAREKLKLGLFSYPVLQAADILLYQATLVPVGEDQLQHVEFARHIATSFNSEFKHPSIDWALNIPIAQLSPAKRIMSLRNPTQKMSKSDPSSVSRIMITDTVEEIAAKFRFALTDSTQGITYDPAARPGVSNLIEIYKHTTDIEDTCEDIARQHANMSMKAFKEMVADAVIQCLAGIRDRYLLYMTPGNEDLEEAAQLGHRRASARANLTLHTIQEAVGLKPRRPGKGMSNEKTLAIAMGGSKYDMGE